ncbi:MAG: response regulator [Chloroflexi bacterium]|nr:response regulator [Chloroflexota bacterium]
MKRILVVDDEESIRITLSTILTREGYTVQAVGSFDEVTQILPSFPPDTIILDVLLPKVSGLDILKYLKEQGVDAPVIIITGAPDIQSARESLRHGAYDYIAKPFTLDILRQSVSRAIKEKELLDARRELEEQKRRYQEDLERQVRERTAELQRRNAELAALNRLGAILAESLSLEDTLQGALAELVAAVRSPLGAVYLLRDGSLWPAAVVAQNKAVADLWPPSLDASVLEISAPGPARAALEVLPDDLRKAVVAAGADSAWLTGLISKAEAEGVLIIAGGAEEPDASLLSASARQIAVAVQNAKLFEESVTRRQHTEAIIQNMADGVLVLDRQDRISVCNPALRNILNILHEDLLGRSIHDFRGLPDPGLAALWEIGAPSADLLEQLQAMASNDADATGLPAVVRREVSLSAPLNRVVMVYTTQLQDLAHNPLGQVRLVRDITRERELERMKSDFVSIVSHELRTPLFYIKGFIELLLHGKAEDPKVRTEFLTIIRDQTDHLTKLVEDILDTSKLEQGNFLLKRERVPVEDLIRQAVADAEGMAANAGVALRVEIAEPLPEVIGDFVRLKQVMANLISNAIKFSKSGGAAIVRGLPKPGEVWVQVEDQGAGIPSQSLPHVFDKFFQAEPSQTRSSGGAGLGLYIAKQIIEHLGGRIWAESELGKGSTFTFALPVQEDPADDGDAKGS